MVYLLPSATETISYAPLTVTPPTVAVEVKVTQVPTDAPLAVSVTVINLLPAEEANGLVKPV
jgi:hypothetical protein